MNKNPELTVGQLMGDRLYSIGYWQVTNSFLMSKFQIFLWLSVFQAAIILVAMASEKNFRRPEFWQKLPIGDQQIKRETYLKNYQ